MGVNGHWYIEIRKQAFWRGVPHVWDNRYVMSGAQPSGADAITVIGALHDIEDVIYPTTAHDAGVGFVDGKAYPSGKGAPFAQVNYNESQGAGTATGFTGGEGSMAWAPTLETCLLVATPITGLSSSGKPITLRKYFRGLNAGSVEDTTGAELPGAVVTYVNAAVLPWKTGMGSSSWVVIAPSGAQASGAPVCSPYLHNHQIPRGRKKKKVSSSVLGAIVDAVEKGSSLVGFLE